MLESYLCILTYTKILAAKSSTNRLTIARITQEGDEKNQNLM